ncbi:MAG: hypothetical protein J6K84_01120 [Oscillospiraceae bacterium]|nr:hypothetical protein [Oscillospiraceae bacterium]
MDAYQSFMEAFDIHKEQLFDWGIKNTVFPSTDKVEDAWNNLLYRIYNNQEVYIRGYGRNGHATSLYKDFYSFLLGNEHVKEDPTNNSRPKRNIEKITGLKRNQNIFNYQVSHIFGCTKNVFLFEAPWNVCYVPKILDPFTGHEAKGTYISEYQEIFKKEALSRYKKYIDEYNLIVEKLQIRGKVEEYIQKLPKEVEDKQIQQFKEDCLGEFSFITA